MAKSVFQVYVENEGVIVPSPTITVRKTSDNSLATIYADSTGTAKANPFTGTVDGLARFYADAGSYKVTATQGLFTTSFYDVLLGDAAGYDVGNAAGKLMTRATADGRYVLQGQSLTKIVDAKYFATQNPTALNSAMQIIWNNADINTAYVDLIGAANGVAANRGKINWLGAGQFQIELALSLGRVGAAGVSNLYLLFKENGVAVSGQMVQLLTDSDTTATFTSTALADITAASTWTFELYRVQSGGIGDNSGGLVAFDPDLAGLPNIAPAQIKIWKIL